MSGSVTFLGHDIVDVYRAKRDCGSAWERRSVMETSDDEHHHAPRFLAGRGLMKSEDRRVRLEGVFGEQDGEVRVASIPNELVGDVRNVIIGFL